LPLEELLPVPALRPLLVVELVLEEDPSFVVELYDVPEELELPVFVVCVSP